MTKSHEEVFLNQVISYYKKLEEADFTKEQTQKTLEIVTTMIENKNYVTKSDLDLSLMELKLELKILIKLSTVLVIVGGIYSSILVHYIQQLL